MAIGLAGLGQVALPVRDIDAAEQFYEKKLGLRKLFRAGNLSFFDMAGVRLLLDQFPKDKPWPGGGVLYFRVPDIALARRALVERGVTFTDDPHCIAQMEDHDLWMTFFSDLDGNVLALMMEAPKGYAPS